MCRHPMTEADVFFFCAVPGLGHIRAQARGHDRPCGPRR